ncbi:MAG: DUF2971 domain-containing protein [Alphaproteobacteria bacterium]|nr:DUF2971 domain-containing protein [Alphaproteobacteria bacterium]
MPSSILRRYTNLASTLHVLRTRTLTLLDPSNWDDRNDRHFMEVYRREKRVRFVRALCFAQVDETYHHWRVFSHGADGVRIEFRKEPLLTHFARDSQVRADAVAYARIDQVEREAPALDDLPFLKRLPYQDEREFRIVYTGDDEPRPYTIALDAIRRINLSPWLPEPLQQSVKSTLRSIDGCADLEISASTLIDNRRWKEATIGVEE